MTKKQTYILVIAIIVVLVIIGFSTGSGKEGLSEEVISEADEGIILGESSEKEIIKELKKIEVPNVGDTLSDKKIAIPRFTRPALDNEPKDSNVWWFDAYIENGELKPSEFRIPAGDVLMFNIENIDTGKYYELEVADSLDHTKLIFFPPDNTHRIVLPSGNTTLSQLYFTDAGTFDVLCIIGCSESVIGKIIVIPKK